MDEARLRSLLEEVASGSRSIDEAVLSLRGGPFEDLGFAKVDTHRGIRQGVPEVIFGATKTPEQIVSIAETLLSAGNGSVIVTRLSEESADEVSRRIPFRYDPVSRVGIAGSRRGPAIYPWPRRPRSPPRHWGTRSSASMMQGSPASTVSYRIRRTSCPPKPSWPSQAWRGRSPASSGASPIAR